MEYLVLQGMDEYISGRVHKQAELVGKETAA
jgi:hypothetical protein